MAAPERRKRTRRRSGAAQGPPQPRAAEPDEAPRPARQHREHHAERGLRDLVGAGHSQLGVSGALRGRDVNRPSEQDLAEAERDVVLVRRHWKPPTG